MFITILHKFEPSCKAASSDLAYQAQIRLYLQRRHRKSVLMKNVVFRKQNKVWKPNTEH